MSMYDKNHYNIVIILQLIKINEKKKERKEYIKNHQVQPCPGTRSGRSSKQWQELEDLGWKLISTTY